jgi:thiol-disulfide isomerase/thioredoxin
MFNRANALIVAVAILGAGLGLYVGSYVASPQRTLTAPVLKAGERLTDLQLSDIDGRSRQLSDWNGKFVLVNFWATWCGPCREEMPLLDRTHRELAGKGLEVVGVAIDDAAAVGTFLKDSPVQYPILVGGSNDTLHKFGDGSGVLPYSVLIDRDGKLLAQRAGSFSAGDLSRWLEQHLAQ